MSENFLCKCSILARGKNDWYTDHHERCPHYDPIGDLKSVIADLVKGIECWAADEDGVHPECWEAYKKAVWISRGEILKDSKE